MLARPALDASLVSLESPTRLSRSLLWRAQRAYFHREGVGAWRSGTVPHHVTNRPALARAYADVALGFVRDCRADDGGAGEGVTILEIGAGSGRFAYLFLCAFVEAWRSSPARDVPVRYLMTDFTDTNLAFWRAHPSFAPWVAEGLLDFALFDAERDAAIAPSGSPTLAATGRRRPIVAIANYVFDSLPQDAYRCERGAVEPWLVSLVANAALDADDPALLSRTTVRAERGPACVDPHGDPELDAIWRACVAEAPTGTVLFPVGALGCVRRLLDASGNRLLLLCGDRGGWPSPDATSVDEGPLPSFHGSVSLDVDFRPIAELFRRRGGDVLRGEGGRRDFAVAAFVSGGAASGDADTRAAWARALADDAPGDLLRLRHGVERQLDDLGTEAMLALIRLSHWDPRVLEICLPALAAGAADATEDTKCALAQAIERCWTQWFFLGEPRDFPHEVGLVLAALGAHEQAAARFADSLRLYGEDAATRWNLGVCLARLGRAAEGARCLERAWEVDPDFAPRGAWQKKRAERSPFG